MQRKYVVERKKMMGRRNRRVSGSKDVIAMEGAAGRGLGGRKN